MIWLLVLAAVLLAGLLWGEKKEHTLAKLACKTPLSGLFVLVALMQTPARPEYYAWVLAGLVLGLVGDVCLALPGNGAFRAGLVSFLLGHVAYVVAFAGLTKAGDWVSLGALAILAVSGVVFFWLRPHLGPMLIPVVAYILVISAMMMGAWGVLGAQRTALAGARLIFWGALFFYLSDLLVARDRFVAPGWINRLVGLPLYYAGQFLLAFSVAWVS